MTQHEHRKQCMARYIQENDLEQRTLPSVIRARENSRRRNVKNKTWSDWWRERYKQEFREYILTI